MLLLLAGVTQGRQHPSLEADTLDSLRQEFTPKLETFFQLTGVKLEI